MEPSIGLADAGHFVELAEHEADGLLHAQVRILDDVPARIEDVTRCQAAPELAATGLGLAPVLQAQLQGPELDHAQRALDAEHLLVVETAEVVEVLRVAEQRVEDPAQLHQVTPILVGAREPREFATEHQAHLAECDAREQFLEAFTRRGTAGGAQSQVSVDDLDVPEAVELRRIRQRVL